MGLKHCKLTDRAQRRLIEFFCGGSDGAQGSDLLGIHANSTTLFYRKLRVIIADKLDQQAPEFDGEIEEAEHRFDRAETWDPHYGRCWQRRIALYGHTGNRKKAEAAAQKLRELDLPVEIDAISNSYPFRRAEHRDLFMNGLRQAGLN